MEMRLAANITAMHHDNLRQEAQYRVMGMVKEKVENEGASIVRLLEKQKEISDMIESHRGQNLNIYA